MRDSRRSPGWSGRGIIKVLLFTLQTSPCSQHCWITRMEFSSVNYCVPVRLVRPSSRVVFASAILVTLPGGQQDAEEKKPDRKRYVQEKTDATSRILPGWAGEVVSGPQATASPGLSLTR